jgi:adenine-specific DNA-methyltransferase
MELGLTTKMNDSPKITNKSPSSGYSQERPSNSVLGPTTKNRTKKIPLGQYFTKNQILKTKLFEMIKNNPNIILEPSVGRGDLVVYCKERLPDVSFDMYEIDPNIEFLVSKEDIIFGNFLEQKIEKNYTTIIANPPFIRTKGGNLYIDFIEKCFNLLTINGEMIFIIPSDFFHLTSAASLIMKMVSIGSFTDIYHPNVENLFENASIDVLIFRYQKTNQKQNPIVIYNNKETQIHHSNGLITFTDPKSSSKEISNRPHIKDIFDVFVGLVSGKDEVFKSDIGNIEVLVDHGSRRKFIYLEEFPSNNQSINSHLLSNKDLLMHRKIRKFNENNWYQWGAPRNIKIMKGFKDEDCIYIHNLTRKDNIAFIGKVEYFGGNLLMLKPKIKMTKEILLDTIIFLNSKDFKQNFIYSGRFKIGHKQLSDSFYL